jgi:aldose 1-epimerase
VNNGPNSLHGGLQGFDKKCWTIEKYDKSENIVVFSLVSKHEEEGYPGEIKVTVQYALQNTNDLTLDYSAEWTGNPINDAIQETAVNLTNHSYFNLSGLENLDVKDHICAMPDVTGVLELDDSQIPTGKVIAGSSMTKDMDFASASKTFGDGLKTVTKFRGYDHFFMVNPKSDAQQPLPCGAKVHCSTTGISLSLFTDAIGFQLYTGNWLDGSITGKESTQENKPYGQYSGFCLEASHPPEAANHQQWRNSVILRKGEGFKRKDVYRVQVENSI